MRPRPNFALAFAITIAASVMGPACAYDPPLQRVGFRVLFGGVSRDPGTVFAFQSPQGWTITYTAAQIAIGPIYFHNGAAGAGTDQDDGRVVAEVLEQFTVDALNPNLGFIAGAGTGITEPSRTSEVRLFEAIEGPIADAAGAGAAVAHVAGVAQQGSVAIAFDLTLQLGTGGVTAYQSTLQHRVPHIPAEFTAGEGGTLTVRVDPTHWLDNVVFDAVRGTVPDSNQPATARQLLSGVGSSTGVFAFTWDP